MDHSTMDCLSDTKAYLSWVLDYQVAIKLDLFLGPQVILWEILCSVLDSHRYNNLLDVYCCAYH